MDQNDLEMIDDEDVSGISQLEPHENLTASNKRLLIDFKVMGPDELAELAKEDDMRKKNIEKKLTEVQTGHVVKTPAKEDMKEE
jgi:hypothetical protein